VGARKGIWKRSTASRGSATLRQIGAWLHNYRTRQNRSPSTPSQNPNPLTPNHFPQRRQNLWTRPAILEANTEVPQMATERPIQANRRDAALLLLMRPVSIQG
jgi:hypothetical protein